MEARKTDLQKMIEIRENLDLSYRVLAKIVRAHAKAEGKDIKNLNYKTIHDLEHGVQVGYEKVDAIRRTLIHLSPPVKVKQRSGQAA